MKNWLDHLTNEERAEVEMWLVKRDEGVCSFAHQQEGDWDIVFRDTESPERFCDIQVSRQELEHNLRRQFKKVSERHFFLVLETY